MKEKKFGDVMPKEGDFNLQRIGEFEGETLGFIDARFAEGNYGEYAVITLDDGMQIRSGNEVVLDQLHKMAEHFDGETVIKAKVVKPSGKRFYKLVDPDE